MAVSSVAPNRTDFGSASPLASPEVTVHRGDTLSGIAARHGVSLAALERANPQIANPNLILPGQQVHLPGAMHDNAAAPSVASAAGLPTSGAHANAAAIAERYLGQNASTLEATHGGNGLPMQAGVDTHHSCANFVSAVLTQAGLLSPNLHTNSVAQLDHTLRSQGWTPVSAANARPGDVVIIRGGGVSHTEIVSGPGRMIGSNNVNRDGSQRITHNNLGWAVNHGAVILRPPAGAGAAAVGTAAAASRSSAPTRAVLTTPTAANRLGSLSMVYETSCVPGQEGRAAAKVSSGQLADRPDPGGISYGAYQLTSSAKGGRQVQAFLANEDLRWAQQFIGLDPTQAGAFGNRWREIAAREPQAFLQAQHDYIERTHYDPVISGVLRHTGVDLNTHAFAVRDVVWSMSVQHGRAEMLVSDAVRSLRGHIEPTNEGYDRALIGALYDRREAYARANGFTDLINGRYVAERRDAIAMLNGR